MSGGGLLVDLYVDQQIISNAKYRRLASPADVLRGSSRNHSCIRAVNSFPIVRKYQLESTCQKQKHSYLSLYLTKFHHTFTKIIRKLFSIQGVNYFLRAVKKIPGFFLTNAMPTIKYRKVTSTEKQSYLSLQLTKFYHSFSKMILKLFSI